MKKLDERILKELEHLFPELIPKLLTALADNDMDKFEKLIKENPRCLEMFMTKLAKKSDDDDIINRTEEFSKKAESLLNELDEMAEEAVDNDYSRPKLEFIKLECENLIMGTENILEYLNKYIYPEKRNIKKEIENLKRKYS